MTSFPFFINLFVREATLLKGKQLCAKGNNYAASECDKSDSDLLVSYSHQHEKQFKFKYYLFWIANVGYNNSRS